jgi:hypothetical protein
MRTLHDSSSAVLAVTSHNTHNPLLKYRSHHHTRVAISKETGNAALTTAFLVGAAVQFANFDLGLLQARKFLTR